MQQEADTPARGEKENAFVDCGWGRLIFANTFRDTATLVSTLRSEQDGQRDIAFYVDEPQMVLAGAPQSLFLDPSLCYRLDLSDHAPLSTDGLPFHIRPLKDEADVQGASNVYAARGMIPLPSSFNGSDGSVTLLVAEDNNSGEILGAVMGVDHVEAFGDAMGSASLWSLAVAPSAPHGKVGEYLVRALADRFRALGRAYLDLTVMQDNAEASALYEKLGFVRVPVFSVKCRNRINERLYAGTNPAADLNPYGRIIVEEALRRGIRARWLLVLGLVWSVPLVIGPPLFTADPWFYTAIGNGVQLGVDPFEQGPGVLGDIEAVRGAEEFWRFSPTPYSPPFVALLSGLSWLLGQDVLAQLVAIRVLCVAAWAVCAVVVCRIARHLGGSPAVAMWLGAINPLVLLHLVSGAHNDALMLGLLLPGLLLALKGRPLLGILLCVAAAGIKATALIVVLVIGVDWARRQTTWPARLRALALAMLASVQFGVSFRTPMTLMPYFSAAATTRSTLVQT